MSQSKSSKRFKAFKEQDRFLWADKRYYGYISGVGAGKTFAGIIRTYLNMMKWNPGEMGAIIAPTRQMVVNVIIPEMRDMGLLGNGCPWSYNSAHSDEPGIHAENGSRALILSADNQKAIERLRGLNLAWVWMDEEAVIDARAREIAMQRLRTGEYRNLYITTTPKGKNHTYEFFVGDVDTRESQYGRATIHEAEDRVAITGVPTDANPHTPADYKDAMESDLPDQIRAQEVEGQFVEIGSGLLTRDMLSFMPASEIPEHRNMKYVVGVDLGVEADSTRARERDSDYWSAALVMVNTYDKEAYLIDVIRDRGLTLREGIQWLQRICADVPNPKVRIESNQAQRWLFQLARDEGLNVEKVNNTQPKEERIVQMSIPFETGAIKLVNREVDEQLGYDPRWRDFVQEWLAFPEGGHDDMIDSCEIALQSIDLGGASGVLSGDLYNRDKD